MSKFITIMTIIMVAFAVFVTVDVAVAQCSRSGYHGGGGGGGAIPEIDSGVAPSAIALLSCGLLILARKFGRK